MPNERERRGDGMISHCRHAPRSLAPAARRTRTLHANRDGDLNDLIRGTTQLQGDRMITLGAAIVAICFSVQLLKCHPVLRSSHPVCLHPHPLPHDSEKKASRKKAHKLEENGDRKQGEEDSVVGHLDICHNRKTSRGISVPSCHLISRWARI